MKKLLLTGIVIVVFVLYAIYRNNATTALPVTSNTSSKESVAGTSTSVKGTLKDGTYTGSAANAFYGTLQVQATIQNGKIIDVQFLKYPSDQEESKQVSAMAMPALKQEAIQSQSANVDVVSGATQTSQAFKESLAAALSQAKA